MAELSLRCGMVSIVVLRGVGAATCMLLLQRRARYMEGAWTYVAGHLEPGETGWQTARRELAEETGLQPDALYATSFCEQFYDAGNDCIQIVPAFVARVADAARVQLNAEHAAFRWVTLDEAMEQLPFGSQRDLLVQVRREFVERTPADILRMPTRA